MIEPVYYSHIMESPLGKIRLLANDQGLCAVEFESYHPHCDSVEAITDGNHPVLRKAEKQLQEYFVGKRKSFDLVLAPRGTIFQLKAWKTLQSIPYAQTISYGQQAAQMGDAKKARAVGAANGRNPVSIIIPCHRVIGVSGALTGYASGLAYKEKLLALEQRYAA